MMEAERLKEVLSDLSDSLVGLQQQIEKANQLLADTAQVTTGLPATPSSGSSRRGEKGSPSALQARVQHLERRVLELEASEQELTMHLEDLLQRHGVCETEIGNAVLARESIMKRYRHLVRVAVDLLQTLTQVFPPGEEVDEETRRAVEEDLRRESNSPSTETSSCGTARPSAAGNGGAGDANGDSDEITQSTDVTDGPRVGSSVKAGTSHTPDAGSQLSATALSGVGQEGSLPTWVVHYGAKCPGCVKTVAGPFVQADFLRLGFDSDELDDLFQSLILPRDVFCRLAAPPSPRVLGNIRLAFLYDPFYLESGTKTYILDWGTAQANRKIISWLQNNSQGNRGPVFHTFTFPTRKNCWYYFGGLSWNVVPFNDIWPTLNDQSRVSILRRLGERSHGTVDPEEIARQLADGRLQQLCIEIASANGLEVMHDIASRLGRSPQETRAKRPIVRGEQ